MGSSQSAGRSVWVSPAALAAGPVGLVDVTTATGRLPFHKKKTAAFSFGRTFVFVFNLSLRLPQVDKVTGRFNGQFKTYAICGAIRRMVSVYSSEV